MARTKKDSLSYFPFDVTFFDDDKIVDVQCDLGVDGVLMYIFLLAETYGGKGYYLEWGRGVERKIIRNFGFKEEKIRLIIDTLLRRSLFDNTLFKSGNVLTSRRIQLQYQQSMASIGKTRDVVVDGKLWLLKKSETQGFIKCTQNEDFFGKNEDFFRKNVNNCGENDTNENKINKSKINEMSGADAHEHHDNDIKMVSVSIGRELTHGEKCAVRAWRQLLGMSGEMIALACDRCVTYKGQMITAYVNAILQKWHRQGICTVEQANAADGVLSNNKQDKSLTDHDELERLAFKNL